MKDSKYYIGLDIGTNSVGWAVTDKKYNVLKLNGKRMWGSRLFEEAQTAEDRRIHRSNRRRLQRRKYRLDLLQELFQKEIEKVDPNFFIRLDESKYHFEDRSCENVFVLFNYIDRTDKDFFEKYPTVYHLRQALIDGTEDDIRSIFLGIHHIIKYRGHFLFSGKEVNIGGSINEVVSVLLDKLKEITGDEDLYYSEETIKKVTEILLSKEKSKSDKQKEIVRKFDREYKNMLTELFKLALGLKANMEKVFVYNGESLIEFEDDELKKLQFGDKFEEDREKIEDFYKGYFEIIELAHMVHDTVNLSQILEKGKGLSESKIISYEKHKEDLKKLKDLLKRIDEKYGFEKENKLFYKILREDKDKGTNYINYSGNSENGKTATAEDFYKFLKKTLEPYKDEEEFKSDIEYIISEIELEKYLPKQRDKINGAIPYQLHRQEMVKILEKASEKYDFLNKVEDGISIKEKIISLLEFRVPYYVGPLNNYHNVHDNTGYAWIEKKKNEKIYPWNFNEVVDIEESAENFISSLTNRCTYLQEETVLPKNSLIYSKFMLLNELNNLRYAGQPLDTDIKSEMIKDLFEKNHRKITISRIKSYLKNKGYCDDNCEITGINIDIKADLKSYRDMVRIFGEKFNFEMAEDLINWITIFGNEKKILSNKINKEYGNIISKDQLKEILKLNYKDWGRLSRKLLTGIKVDHLTGEPISILTAMESGPKNFMELLSKEYGYIDKINETNAKYYDDDIKITPELLDDLYVSPTAKRGIWQSIRILEEIKKIMGNEPEKIFIETTRTNKAEKTVKSKRKDKLEEIYRYIKNSDYIKNSEYLKNSKSIKSSDYIETLNKLKKEDSDRFKIKKVYLYFMQMGRCMYTGELINYEQLFTNEYDIDHIYPRSQTKDDSLQENLVLVKSKYNRSKTDNYPISKDIQNNLKVSDLWRYLVNKGLITKEKYYRLTRTTPLTDEELAGFISRQIVFTSQITKATADILKVIYKDSNICYVKAENVSDFRHGSNRNAVGSGEEFVKCREVNDFHHAKDAYINIVVGNVFDVKFTRNPYNFIKKINDEKRKYSLNYIFNYKVERNGEVAWNTDESMKTVEKMMANNDVRITRLSLPLHSELYDATISKAKKAKKEGYLPLKSSGNTPLKDVTKYGGYPDIKTAYFSIYEYEYEKKSNLEREVRIVPIPLYLSKKSESEIDLYINDYLNSKVKKEIKSKKKLFNRLYINDLVKINGYYYYVGGKTNNNIYIDNAVNIIIDSKYEKIIKNLSKLIEFEGKIYYTDEELIEVFDYLVNKSNSNIFSKKKKQISEKIDKPEVRKRFKELNINDKAKIILEILNCLTEKNTTRDLKLIGETYSRATMSFTFKDIEEFTVINQSVTGLFSNEIRII